ncbi:right-handed parallel beta-helix repeat-containing protein [Methylomonas paludis]|uniref:Right-handed parallel beta-helix repeat-containing protein n=1 Tax=Methylomonas paludis TaxID=1173101 RepID=A0A975R9P5_9GAMM|nr:right-handed parallel beta-helix repeat-containing protein [Methylomonas paludis]QWF71645.1 right-handed parallel beta-helix repeat-containing protein [Methylomonas paludis]
MLFKFRKNHFGLFTAILLLAGTLLGCMPQLSLATCSTYYVATNGSDSNPGTLTRPWKTIATSGYKIKACDTLYVRGGTYKEYAINLLQNSTAANPTRVLAYPGESPVLDASTLTPGLYDAFFNLSGQYIVVSGFEVRNGGTGIYLSGNYTTVSNLIVHNVQGIGILAKGDYSVVQNCTVYQTSLIHYNYLIGNGGSAMWGTGISAARNPVTGITQHATLTGNTVYNVWGEGLSTYEASGTIISNNVVYDNWAENTYISDATNVIFKDNLVYNTNNNVVGKKANLLSLADEVSSVPRSTNNAVINNMFLNGNVDLFSWTLVSGSGLTNALVSNNTLVNGELNLGPINQASIIQNNIIYRNDGGPLASGVPALSSNLQFVDNLWSSTPPFNSAYDLVGDPELALSGSTAAGQLAVSYFTVDADNDGDAPAVGTQINTIVGSTLITSQGNNLNIGAYLVDPLQYIAQ